MKLRDYLDAEKITPVEFARQVEVTPQALYRYMAGDRHPRRAIARKIVELTHGQVTPNDMLDARA